MPRRGCSRSCSGTRGRTRDRSVRPHCRRDHRDTISPSVSRDLYRPQEEEPAQAIKKLVTSQQEIILDRLPEHRAEVEEKIQLKARPFLSKQIAKQYHVNAEFRDLTAKASVALEASEVG